MLALAACGSDEKVTGDPLDQSKSPSTAHDGGSTKTDGGKTTGTKTDGGTSSGGNGSGTVTGTSADDGTGTCGKSNFRTGAIVPDMLIVLDRSGSMKPPSNTLTLNCQNADPITSLTCAIAGIDCTSQQWANTTNCGGTQTAGPVDRWDPSVAAINNLTAQFDSTVSFGLMTFPAQNNDCGPGELQVPVGPGTSKMIASKLSGMQPGGGTPTGDTLKEVLQLFMQNQASADTVSATQYVLLVTDGQPTCPNARGGSGNQKQLQADLQLTLDQLDALRMWGVKTFVVGYDAALDATFSDGLTQMAVHGGTDKYYPVQDENSLSDAFQSISKSVATCSFVFKQDVTDPTLVHVTLDGTTLRPNDPDGWTIDGNTVTVQGSSCEAIQGDQGHQVQITMECTPVIYM